MADNKRLIADSADLREREAGIRFALPELDDQCTGFVIRYNGKVHGFVNRCAHVPVELDWNEGDFFDISKNYLICATHGAHYTPETGFCVFGPCKGRSLQKLQVVEQNGKVWLLLDAA